MDDVDEPTARILEMSRFWVQRVLVPMLVCVGVVGNTVTVMVLTRRRMRSSTNIYLSALAIADIIHLLFVLLLSFKHYPNIHDRKYELYWRFFGLMHWLCDVASSSSVWLTVSFTVERYIAVCHPIKGKVLCTENRAKSIIVIVYIFCLLTTASTTFEYQLTLNESCIKECKITHDIKKLHNTGNALHNGTLNHHYIQSHTITLPNFQQGHPDYHEYDMYLQSQLQNILSNCTSHPHVIYVPIYPPSMFNLTTNKKVSYANLIENQVVPPSASPTATATALTRLENGDNNSTGIDESVLEVPKTFLSNSSLTNDVTENMTCCLKKFTIDTEFTSLAKNKTYTTFINWYTSIFFVLLPLALIATFNCFLVHAVYTSQKRRKQMTNSQENMTISNENRITLMLIGVVVLFLVCQTPTAILLIYNIFQTNEPSVRSENIQLILGNVFNFLMIINASCNFVLYCVLSRKFRSTFRKLFCERRKKRQDTIALSTTSKSRNSQRFNPYKHGIRRNASEYHTPRNLETQSLTSVPRSKSVMVRVLGKAKSTDLNV